MKNKIIAIGFLSGMKCYLNVDTKEAIESYCKSEEISEGEFNNQGLTIKLIEFDKEFEVYDIWES